MRFGGNRSVRLVVLACATRIALSASLFGAEQAKQPVFVGVKACAECHDGKAMGNQFTIWHHTKHSRAYTSLFAPEAKEITKLSGIPLEPHKSAMCLGCHATGADAEDWEKDPTFSMRDGVQCEKCHGPGSEYMDANTMMDREKAIAAGLNIPTADDCMKCHQEKGSHTAVLKRPPVDIEKAIEQIKHPVPENWSLDKLPIPKPPVGENAKAKYLGAQVCGECHSGPETGRQFAKWRDGKHADAYAVLGTPAAAKIAAEMRVKGDPRTEMACLSCHATAYHVPSAGGQESYAIQEGVGCEACHGPGSQYAGDPAAQPRQRCDKAGVAKITPATCAACHEKAHGKPFDHQAALKEIAHPTEAPPVVQEVRYKTPLNLALRPDGKEIYVACEASGSVIVVDIATRRKVAEISIGGQANHVAFRPDGRQAYVSNRLEDKVAVIDVAARKVIAEVPVGGEPHGLLTDRAGKNLYVLNTMADSISVIDIASLKEIRRLSASRSPWALALSPDGSRFYATNSLSRFVKYRAPSVSEVTVIDAERGAVEDRIKVPAANLLLGVAWHPSGKFAVCTLLRTKNLVPMTRLAQGWTITNGLGILWADGRVDQVLLDEPGLCFPDPTDVVITPDGRLALITSATSDRVAVVDLAKLVNLLEKATPDERERIIPNHLGKSAEFLVGYIPTKNSPRGIAIAQDGKTAYTADSLDDSLTVIDVPQLKPVDRIDLGGPKEITKARFGERLFHSSKITFRRQFSCHSCHPDGHVDGLTYDIEEDGPGGGIGKDPVDNRTLRGIIDTAPFKWSGLNPTLARQCGPRLSAFFTRLQPFGAEEIAALDYYISTIPRAPNRFRPVGAPLSETQRRGKAVFERTRKNDGTVIPKEKRCVTCHFPPLFTDRRLHDVGTKTPLDSHEKFDTPHLNNIFDSAPYLHNGIADTLEEIWTKYNLYDQHGITNDMTKDQLNDLIEYLKTL